MIPWGGQRVLPWDPAHKFERNPVRLHGLPLSPIVFRVMPGTIWVFTVRHGLPWDVPQALVRVPSAPVDYHEIPLEFPRLPWEITQ